MIYLWLMSLITCLTLTDGASAQGRKPSPIKGLGVDYKFNQQVPLELRFHNEAGEDVQLSKYLNQDKPVILTLVYFKCPSLCTFLLTRLTETMQRLAVGADGLRLGRDFTVITVSFDPTETPEMATLKKRTYVKEYLSHFPDDRSEEVNKGWHFLTGEASQSKKLADAVGFKYKKHSTKPGEYVHPSCFIVLTKEGKVKRYLADAGANAPQVRNVRFALLETSELEMRGANSGDRLQLLFCYTYDATTGKYSLSVINLVRIGGVLTLLLLGGTIVWLCRSERKKKLTTVEE